MYRFEISPIGLVVNVTAEITHANRAPLEAAIALASREGGAFFVSLEACRSIDTSALEMFRDMRARYCERLHVVVSDGSPPHDALRCEPFGDALVIVPEAASDSRRHI